MTAITPLRWLRTLDHASLETAIFESEAGGHRLRGEVLVLHEGQPLVVRYTLHVDPQGRSRLLDLEQDFSAQVRRLSLERGADGAWHRDGRPLPGLEDCEDVDLGLSPSTNAFPIRRMRTAGMARMELCTVWVEFPSLEVQRSAQRYTRLAADSWRYENLDSGFSTRLVVDDAGFVLDYAGVWRRLRAQKEEAGFTAALLADGPSPELSERAEDVGWLVGGWRAQVRDFDADADGRVREGRGEWWFAWVLEGRALQDVWISPPRSERGAPRDPAGANDRYGTTLRRFDHADGQWHMTWINPVSAVENRLSGGRTPRGIELRGVIDGRPVRWCFEDVERDRFTWRGYVQDGPDQPWRLQAEFLLERIPGSTDRP
jgi:hypothetical protein